MLKYWLSIIILIIIGLGTAPAGAVSGKDHPGSRGPRGIKSFRSLIEIRNESTVRQKWDLSCGSAALSTILTHHYGDKISEAVIITSILRITDPVKIRNRGGFSLFDLKRFVESRGYDGKGYADMTLADLLSMNLPAIVPIKSKGLDHFVVFRGIRGNKAVISDPAFGTVIMEADRFVDIWKGGIGFFVIGRGPDLPAGLKPEKEDFLIPDGGAIGRALSLTSAPLTRR